MIISIDRVKTFHKILYPFMIKTFNNLGIERNFLKLIKSIHKKPKANIIFKDECMKASPVISSIRNVPSFDSSSQHCTGYYNQ